LAFNAGYRAFDGAHAYGTELKSIADDHGVSPGQVVLRWHLQSGRTVLPKSSNIRRLRENLEIFGFSLTEKEIKAIDALGDGDPRRTCPDPAAML
jgi:2,5-diketo-D-gluconate reductase A